MTTFKQIHFYAASKPPLLKKSTQGKQKLKNGCNSSRSIGICLWKKNNTFHVETPSDNSHKTYSSYNKSYFSTMPIMQISSERK